MQHEYGFSETYGVDGSVSTAGVVFDNFQYASTAKTFQHFRCFVLLAALGGVECMAEEFPYGHRQSQ